MEITCLLPEILCVYRASVVFRLARRPVFYGTSRIWRSLSRVRKELLRDAICPVFRLFLFQISKPLKNYFIPVLAISLKKTVTIIQYSIYFVAVFLKDAKQDENVQRNHRYLTWLSVENYGIFWTQVDPNFLTIMASHGVWGVTISCLPDGKLPGPGRKLRGKHANVRLGVAIYLGSVIQWRI